MAGPCALIFVGVVAAGRREDRAAFFQTEIFFLKVEERLFSRKGGPGLVQFYQGDSRAASFDMLVARVFDDRIFS